MSIKQEGTYEDYLKKFVTYLGPLPNMAKDVLKDAFVNGLWSKLCAEVLNRHPMGLDECMKEAQVIEDRNLALKLFLSESREGSLSKSEAQSEFWKGTRGNEPKAFVQKVMIPKRNSLNKEESPIKRLADVEIVIGEIRGAIFKCDDK